MDLGAPVATLEITLPEEPEPEPEPEVPAFNFPPQFLDDLGPFNIEVNNVEDTYEFIFPSIHDEQAGTTTIGFNQGFDPSFMDYSSDEKKLTFRNIQATNLGTHTLDINL